MTNLESILKSRDITLPTKVRLVKAMVFPVVMYGCASWTAKKAEHQRIDAFELWSWRRCLRVPWTARRSNQSILKEISPECSLEGQMLKLKLQYSSYLMQRVDSLENTLMLWKIEGRRRRGRQRGWDGWMASLNQWTWVWVNSGRWWWTGRPGVLQFMGWQRVGATELNWTEQHLEIIVRQLAHRGGHRVDRQEESLIRAGRGRGRWWSWGTISNRRWGVSCNVTHAWCWWNTRSHLWKFTTWRFTCRGLSVCH